ncbi:MAG: acetoin utilization deacetylase AcuC-like enzyme [Myxococcota bacterium]|jgi:acetoin utilization deacetylase AcuC-like enzyme
MSKTTLPAFFHPDQLLFKPLYEWGFGERIAHPETTARAESILSALDEDALFSVRPPKPISPAALLAVHTPALLTLYNAASHLPDGETFYPTVFPKHSQGRGDPTRLTHAGHFCFDAGTPLDLNTLSAATWSAACARDAARALSDKVPLTYALSRPPGHHATRDLFGGYCYFNNAGVAARTLRRKRQRVAILDIDFHHGNGTQSLFYKDDKVMMISIHGDPTNCFPYFAGFPEETGKGKGIGFNLNVCLPRGTDGQEYLRMLDQHVLPAVKHFAPDSLVLSAGLDAYELDPVGDFKLTTSDFHEIGHRIGALNLPTVAVQEGGYHTAHLGRNAVALLRGLAVGAGVVGD